MSYNYVIQSTDPKAVDMLKENLSHVKSNNEYMQKVNDHYKEHGTVVGCPGVDDETAEKLNSRVKDGQETPYPGSFFKQNYETMRRLQSNIDRVEQKPETLFKGWQFEGGKAVANLANNRLQLLFNEKPNEQQRNMLKQNGFKWAPTAEAWQRPLDPKTFAAADKISFIRPADGRKPSDMQPKQPQRSAPER
ncbi:MAG: hypothetical protein IJH37_12435 [Clostridia bacterium]|nr:hypothetical protein [Clostridia bacterium]